MSKNKVRNSGCTEQQLLEQYPYDNYLAWNNKLLELNPELSEVLKEHGLQSSFIVKSYLKYGKLVKDRNIEDVLMIFKEKDCVELEKLTRDVIEDRYRKRVNKNREEKLLDNIKESINNIYKSNVGSMLDIKSNTIVKFEYYGDVSILVFKQEFESAELMNDYFNQYVSKENELLDGVEGKDFATLNHVIYGHTEIIKYN